MMAYMKENKMTKDEALKLALEALESAKPKYTRQRKDQMSLGGALDYWMLEQHQRLGAITAIKEALAQPEQEPVMFGHQAANGRYGNYAYSCKSLAETAALENPAKIGYKVIGYYTTPPKRTWVGLTDDNVTEILGTWTPIKNYVRRAEAKLKEKNTNGNE